MRHHFSLISLSLLSLFVIACQSSQGPYQRGSGAESESFIAGQESSKSIASGGQQSDRILAAQRKAQDSKSLASTEDSDSYAFQNKGSNSARVRLTVGRSFAESNGVYGPKQSQAGGRTRLKIDGYDYDSSTCRLTPKYKFQSFTRPDGRALRDRERQWRPKLDIDIFDEPDKSKPQVQTPTRRPKGVLIEVGAH
jgi:hypothetical protein